MKLSKPLFFSALLFLTFAATLQARRYYHTNFAERYFSHICLEGNCEEGSGTGYIMGTKPADWQGQTYMMLYKGSWHNKFPHGTGVAYLLLQQYEFLKSEKFDIKFDDGYMDGEITLPGFASTFIKTLTFKKGKLIRYRKKSTHPENHKEEVIDEEWEITGPEWKGTESRILPLKKGDVKITSHIEGNTLLNLLEEQKITGQYFEEVYCSDKKPPSASINSGRNLFNNNHCVSCHNLEGSGQIGPDLLDNKWRYGNSSRDLFFVIYYGKITGKDFNKRPPMPDNKNLLKVKEIADIIKFLESKNTSIRKPDCSR